MATLKDLKKIVLKLPDTTDSTHFNLHSYKVSDKPFIVIQKDNTHIILKLDKPNIAKFVAEESDVFEEVWQQKKHLIGVRLDIGTVSVKKIRHLVELSWRTKAPKKLIKSFEENARRV
jgi:predicted DNA-binding protein (MmcQ/YjbR family)